MSNIDKQALREAAELFNSEEGDHWWDEEQLTHEDGLGLNEADGKFIATANPATVLALLDELEAKDRRIAEQVEIIANQEKWIKDVEATMITATDRAEAAEKRIAELEARDKPKFVQCWSCKHDIEVLAIADCYGYCPRCAAPIDLDDEPYAATGKGEAS
ncbi:ead/Ea22-like family protein [Enterobacter ludwigii]|uniref:ead/Ea22-like family protein n=1 Tax=Enterobacter ludwigii TaxID=299767 RepID=UPI004067A586